MKNWYTDPLYLQDEIKTLEEGEAAYALREAWFRVYNEYPNDESLAVLWAKSCLETGRWKSIHCYNFGNIRRDDTEKEQFTMYDCGEEVSYHQAQDLIKEDSDRVKIVRTYAWSNGAKRASIKIKAGHLWSQFCAYKTVEDGAEAYIRFVSKKKRYAGAWQKVLQGDPRGYAHELGVAGYYTASEKKYTAGVVRLFNEFIKKKDELLSWKPKTNELKEPNVHDTDIDLILPKFDEIKPEIETEMENAIQPASRPKGIFSFISGIIALIARLFGKR